MQKAFKYRIYPTPEQEIFLSRQFGSVRFIYNHFLANRKDKYLKDKLSSSFYSDCVDLTAFKAQDGYAWLYDINSQTLQASLRNLDRSYQNFFKKRAKFPKFHSKRNKQCIKIPQFFSVEKDKLFIPKLKSGIEINLHEQKKRKLPDKQQCCYISKTSAGKYYVSFQCDIEIKPLEPSIGIVGIDLGIKELITTSEGEVIANPKFYRNAENKLAYEQKQLSKKKLSSKNRNKQRLVVAGINEYIANSRKDYIHKLTKQLIDENQVIIAEDLAVINMVKNHKLAKSIEDAAFGEAIRQLKYKSDWYGRTFHQVNRFFPSSKMCNHCQFILDDLPLSVREWDCPKCSHHNLRDINAGLNIRDQGMRDLGLWNAVLQQKPGEALASAGSENQEAPML